MVLGLIVFIYMLTAEHSTRARFHGKIIRVGRLWTLRSLNVSASFWSWGLLGRRGMAPSGLLNRTFGRAKLYLDNRRLLFIRSKWLVHRVTSSKRWSRAWWKTSQKRRERVSKNTDSRMLGSTFSTHTRASLFFRARKTTPQVRADHPVCRLYPRELTCYIWVGIWVPISLRVPNKLRASQALSSSDRSLLMAP